MAQDGDKKAGVAQVRVDALVAEAFIGRAPAGKPYLLHIDGNLANNEAKNLRWASEEEMKAAGQPLQKP